MLSLLPLSPRAAFELMRDTVNSWLDDNAPSMGAALAYYTVFSISPLLLIVITVAGVVFGAEAARGEVVGQLQGLLGSEGAKAVEDMLLAVSEPAASTLTAALGVLVLLVGATTVFAELQSALDRIWRVPDCLKSSGLFSLLRARMLSFGMILGIGFLLVVSLVLSAGISAMGRVWEGEAIGHILDTMVSLVLMTVVFAMIYKIMPRAKVRWLDVWLGAAVTALLFTLGKFLIGLYIGKSGVASGYGAAGSLIVLLVWVYYSAQIFLLGAEFTWQYAQRFGSLKDGPRRPSLATATERQAGEGSSLRSRRALMEDANAAKSQEWQEGLMTPIVAIYVEEIVRAATGAGDGGQPTATAIADAAEKAFVHFKTSAGRDKKKQRALLSELSGSLTVAEQSGRYSAATRELIRFGVAYVDIYCKS
ncbi:YihY/virulence factor BrkB family protein [Cupriavidus lacunae]|uniref:YihY/virulence factor BrkB family protein n=1 Tax=Cupriavidus lacunae TaxID=2666307 RepID=A0A370MWB9_9BURK|nr:YihY/virulence factor BrkB family protein [Cupriavidus lacunae]